MLEIRDILVRIRIPQIPYLWLMDPDPDPTPDPTPFFVHFKDAKKIFPIFFLLTCPQAHHLQSKNLIFCWNFVLKLYFAGILSVRWTHLWEKEGSGAGSGSAPLTNGSGSGSRRPKNMRIKRIRIRFRIRIPNTGWKLSFTLLRAF